MQRLLLMMVLVMAIPWSYAGEPVYIDVRSPAEYRQGHIEGALLMPHTEIANLITEAGIERDAEITVYCRSGRRAQIAKDTLEDLGYTRVTNGGGYTEVAAKLDEEKASDACSMETC